MVDVTHNWQNRAERSLQPLQNDAHVPMQPLQKRCTRSQLWTTEMFYKRQPTSPSSRQNAVFRKNCRCCFWDFESEIPVRFWSTRAGKQATSGRERTIRFLLLARARCCRSQLVLSRYSLGKHTCWNTCFCLVLLKQDERSRGYGAQKSRIS